MEAAPRLPMLFFDLKTCNENTQLGPQLKQVSILEMSVLRTILKIFFKKKIEEFFQYFRNMPYNAVICLIFKCKTIQEVCQDTCYH